jgi:hypothetical protein
VDGARLETDGVRRPAGGTVREVGLGFKLVHGRTTTRSGSASWRCTRRCCRWPWTCGRCSAAAESPRAARSARWPRRWTFTPRTGDVLHDRRRSLPNARAGRDLLGPTSTS